MTQNSDKQLNTLRQQLDASSENLDSATLEHLAALRRTALDALPQNTSPRRAAYLPWALAGSLAACAFSAFIWYQGAIVSSPTAAAHLSQIEFLEEGDDVEMLQEDIDFYLWLASDDAV